MSLTRKALIAAVVATVALGLLALPGNAAPEKQFSLTFPTSLNAGTQNITVRLKNETPNGNSNINSFRITGSGPTGFRINSITPGTGALSNSNQTISVTNITTLKPQQFANYTLNITVPNVGCNGGAITWTGQAWTGNSLNGDPFRLHTASESNPSQLTSTITSGCNTITVNKYEDTNLNGAKNTGETAPSQSFSFDLKQGTTVLQTKSTTAGVATFAPVTQGNYSVCESSSLPSGWHNSDPGGSAPYCKSFTTSGATTSLDFGNTHDITIDINKFNDANLDGSQDGDESGLSGWSFTLDGNAISGTTANDGSLSTTATPGVSHEVCEVPQTNWFSTTGGNCQTIAAADATSSADVSLDFGNALGNLDCGDNNTITTEDGRATVTRLENTDGSQCFLKPATLTHTGSLGGPDGENVEFLVTGSQSAAYEVVITWDPVNNTNPPDAPATTIDLPGGTHPMEWCVPDGGDLNNEPDLPSGEVGCIVKQVWNFTDATHVQETETIYLEADIVLSKKN